MFWSGIVKNGCGQSISGLLNLLYFKNELLELTDFLHAGTISHKLKTDQNFCVWTFVKNGCGQSGRRTLKLKISKMKRWNKMIFFMLVQI